MAAKREARSRKWRQDEQKQFALVLADDRTEYALTLETLAIKKSANLHIFEAIKKELDACLQKNNISKPIDTSVVKLRAKYKWLKEELRKYDRAKSGSGKSTKEEPEWFYIIDPIFSETHTELRVATKAEDILDSDDCSEGGEDSDKEEETEGMKCTSVMKPRENKRLLNSSSSSEDASSELSHLSGIESEEECNRYLFSDFSCCVL